MLRSSNRIVHQRTTMHPRTSYLINVTELHDDGGTLASAINATVLALCDAGVPMKNMVAASTCCVNESGELILEPTKNDLMDSCAQITAVVERGDNEKTHDGCNGRFVSMVSKGAITSEILQQAMNAIKERTDALFGVFREFISLR